MRFRSLLKNRNKDLLTSILTYDKDSYSNYAFKDFQDIKESSNSYDYSYYCFTLVRCGFNTVFYLLRISDIEFVDGINFLFLCPAYRIDEDMAKKKTVLTEPNRLGLTPGKLSIDLPEVTVKLTNENSYYDAKLKKRVLGTPELQKVNGEKEKKQPVEKKGKVEDEMVNNTDVQVEGKLHSSHFLPPFICTRLWVLNRGVKVGWGWFVKEVEGSKRKNEYYCRPVELSAEDTQYDRGGTFITHAYLKKGFEELDCNELSQAAFINLSKSLEERQIESIQVVIDAILCKS